MHAYIHICVCVCVCGLVSLFNGILTFMGYLIPMLTLLKNNKSKVSKVGDFTRG